MTELLNQANNKARESDLKDMLFAALYRKHWVSQLNKANGAHSDSSLGSNLNDGGSNA